MDAYREYEWQSLERCYCDSNAAVHEVHYRCRCRSEDGSGPMDVVERQNNIDAKNIEARRYEVGV
jgi:hypothetical protein